MTLKTMQFQIIVPYEATNLITNPTPYIDASGYTAITGSLARVTTDFRRSIACIEITPTSGAVGGCYREQAMTSGQQYAFSCDIKGVAGQVYYLQITDTSNNVKATSSTWTDKGYWKRRKLVWTCNSTATYRLKLCRASVASVAVFQTDGWQCVAGEHCTYIDGAQSGFVIDEDAYLWNGTPYASTSRRSGLTRSGGKYVNILDYAKIVTVLGLGLSNLVNIAVPSSFGGSYYQKTISAERPFSLVYEFRGGGDYSVIEAARAALVDALTPDFTIYDQPTLIQCDHLDENGQEVAETLMIPCNYEFGLEMNGQQDAYKDRVALTFRQFIPYLVQDGVTSIHLGFQQDVSSADRIVYRDTSGNWQAMGVPENTVNGILAADDGSIYIVGAFTNVDSVSNTQGIARWTGAGWEAVGTGLNGSASDIVKDAAGNIYVCGSFTLAGGVSGTVSMAYWDGSTWNAMGSGVTGAGSVSTMSYSPDGLLYAGGTFSEMDSVTNTSKIAYWDGSTWHAMGTGRAGSVYTISAAKDGNVYVGGDFIDSGQAYAAYWDGSSWNGMGDTSLSDSVYGMAVGDDGLVYAGGAFTSIGGVTGTAYFAIWNGSEWLSANGGMDGSVLKVVKASDGQIYAGGSFTKAGGFDVPDGLVSWTGSAFLPTDINLPGSAQMSAIAFDRLGNLYVGYDTTGTAVSAIVNVPDVGNVSAYPTVVFTGPGTVFQLKNYTTHQGLYFDLTLLPGEVATLKLDPRGISFTSSFRGSLMNSILPGSDLSWKLLPGDNDVSSYMYGSTDSTTDIYMVLQKRYRGLDGAVR